MAYLGNGRQKGGYGLERNPSLGTIEGGAGITGQKLFGVGRSARATSGPLPSAGYEQRERDKSIRRRAIQNRLQANRSGSTMSPDQMEGII